jgi:hypothetical protein
MKFLDVVAVILAIVSVLLVSSGVASVGLTIGLEKTGQALPASAEPVVSGSGAEVQRGVVEDRDRDAALVLLLFGMFERRRGP